MESSFVISVAPADASRTQLRVGEPHRAHPVSDGVGPDARGDLGSAQGVFFGAFLGAVGWMGIVVVLQFMRVWIS